MRNNFLFGDKYDMNSLFASTARGLEELLKSELEALGAHDCKVVQGGVHFQGDDRLLYQSLLWSRLASRILLPLNEFRVHSDLDLYLGVQAIDWPSIFGVDKTFAVHFSGVNEEIRNSQYGALKVKDAIVDSFTRKLDQRPTVAKQQPDIRVNVFLQRDMASVALDLSGEGLHQRGYRDLTGQAPLKENLAAAIVLRSGWQPARRCWPVPGRLTGAAGCSCRSRCGRPPPRTARRKCAAEYCPARCGCRNVCRWIPASPACLGQGEREGS